ncbi:MAG TPA: sigma 54-interacting transcriptional regulator [Terriglobales bacterium]
MIKQSVGPRSRAAQGAVLSTTTEAAYDLSSIVVRSESLQRVLRLAEKLARHPAAVLIVGETGTGKEMIARVIHNHSLRCNQPWVDVNCAAIPEHLVESELFGYEKGAFSGADTMKPGFFELADKGTLFLDEIGDIDGKVQAKLLRALDGVPYYRLGGSKKVSVNVRVVAATNSDLEELTRSGRFRSDLYHRLAQFRLDVPPLRERPEDILGIAEQTLHEHYPESRFTRDATDALLAYSWPGNVRELRNMVFRGVMQANNPSHELSANDLQLPDTLGQDGQQQTISGDLGQVERQLIFQALERTHGNQGKAAEALGISRRTLIRKLKAYRAAGLDTPVGSIGPLQQRYYRARLEIPVRMKCANETFDGVLVNLSLGGAGVKTSKLLRYGTPVALCFSMPGAARETELVGRVAWTNKDGHHGIQFPELSSPVRTTLQRWLHAEMKKDGWDLSL